MTVRNLKEYIGYLTNGVEIPVIGAPNDPLLKELAGTVENLPSHIGPMSKFATKTGTQIFYEFLQNADDAGASKAFFYFDDENFVVINNGKPFYTDRPTNGQVDATPRKGQLKSFLSKQKGDKYDDDSTIGRYGQGSKLLYDLLTPIHHDENMVGSNKENALIKAIIGETKGPILFSWQQLADLERLFDWQQESISFGTCTDDALPLLAKIIYSYYPSTLNETANTIRQNRIELFSREELMRCVLFLRKIRYKIQLTDYSNGAMIFIPLGEGQGQQLLKSLKNSLLPGISTSLVFLNNLKTVQVLEEEVKKTSVRLHRLPQIIGEDKSFPVTLGLPKNPKEVDLCNFYQYFPVTDTTYGLKFIIQSNSYEIGGDRQRIDLDNERNKNVLKKISELIKQHISDLCDREVRNELIELIKCIVSTDTKKSQKEQLIEKLFYEELLEATESALPTMTGFAESTDSVKIKRTALPVSPSDFGFKDWEWLDESLSDYYEEISDQLGIEAFSIFELLNGCQDREKLDKWMLNLSVQDYQQILTELADKVTFSKLKKLPLVRMSNGETYTLEEIDTDEDLYFITPEVAALEPILRRNGLFCGGLELFQSSEIGKLISQQNKYNNHDYLTRFSNSICELTLNRDEKWLIFLTFKNIPGAKNLLRSEMLLFENQAGEKRPLEKLLKDASTLALSGLLRDYSLKASEAYYDEMNDWLMQKEKIWDQLVADWDSNAPPFEEAVFNQATEDLLAIFNLSKTKKKIPSNLSWIWSDDETWISADSLFHNVKLHQLTETAYQKLCKAVKRLTDFQTVPFKYLAVLRKAAFAFLPEIGLQRISEHWLRAGFTYAVSKDELLLLDFIKLSSESVFFYFIISSGNESGQYLISRKSSNEKQYYSSDRLLNQFLAGTGEFYLLPSELEPFFKNDDNLYKASDQFAQTLINKFGAQRAFIDMVTRHGEAVRFNFLNRLNQISLSSGPEPKRYKDEFEGKVIAMIIQHNREETFRSKVYIDNIPLAQFSYIDEVIVKINNDDPERDWKKFRLSILNPFFEGKSDVLSIVKSKLDGIPRLGNLFKSSRYDLSLLEADILRLPKIQNPEQLSFLISYYYSQAGKPYYNEGKLRLRDYSLLSKQSAFQNFFDKGITFFNDFPLPEQWFDLTQFIDTTEKDLLLSKEYLPDWINVWKNSSRTDEKTLFLRKSGLHMSDCTYPNPSDNITIVLR